jgi:hypothetical protein
MNSQCSPSTFCIRALYLTPIPKGSSRALQRQLPTARKPWNPKPACRENVQQVSDFGNKDCPATLPEGSVDPGMQQKVVVRRQGADGPESHPLVWCRSLAEASCGCACIPFLSFAISAPRAYTRTILTARKLRICKKLKLWRRCVHDRTTYSGVQR